MMSLEEQITFKLQAAWNSCPGLSQLEPLLNVTARAFRDLICPDQLESWLIKVNADALDLIYYQCPRHHWALKRSRSRLYSTVTKMRSDLKRQWPERFANSREQIQKWGIEDFQGPLGLKRTCLDLRFGKLPIQLSYREAKQLQYNRRRDLVSSDESLRLFQSSKAPTQEIQDITGCDVSQVKALRHSASEGPSLEVKYFSFDFAVRIGCFIKYTYTQT